jgi:hypothetical protein
MRDYFCNYLGLDKLDHRAFAFLVWDKGKMAAKPPFFPYPTLVLTTIRVVEPVETVLLNSY